MSLKSICIFTHPHTQYGVLAAFSNELANALNRQGIRCRVLTAQHDNPRLFLDQIFDEAPDVTLSFNGLLPDGEGRFFCDMINIPHVSFLVDSPNRFLTLVASPLSIITCIDPSFCKIFTDFGFANSFFLPHGIDKNLSPPLEEDRIYDVVMLATCIDYQKIRQGWSQKYDTPLCQVLEEAVADTLSGKSPSYLQAFSDALDKQVKGANPINTLELPYEELLDDLEFYIRGLDRIELLKAIKDTTVHIFGSDDELLGDWEKALGPDHPSLILHPAVPYEEALELMKKAKIVLNSSPTRSSHERIFAGLACGAAVLTNDNPYIRENFKDGEEILLFKTGEWDKVNETIRLYLNDEDKRHQLASKGRERVMRAHTWDHRAKTLIKELNPILQRMDRSN